MLIRLKFNIVLKILYFFIAASFLILTRWISFDSFNKWFFGWHNIWCFKCILIFLEVIRDNLRSFMMSYLPLFFFIRMWFLLELDSLHRIQLSLTGSLCTWSGDKNECNTFVFSSFLVYRHIDPGILFAVVSMPNNLFKSFKFRSLFRSLINFCFFNSCLTLVIFRCIHIPWTWIHIYQAKNITKAF